MKHTSSGNFGEKLYVHLADTPYYADGPKVEPIAHKDMLFTRMENLGFTLTLWEDLKGNPVSCVSLDTLHLYFCMHEIMRDLYGSLIINITRKIWFKCNTCQVGTITIKIGCVFFNKSIFIYITLEKIVRSIQFRLKWTGLS